jgi:hypothetical protein
MVAESRHLTLWDVRGRKATCEGLVIAWVTDTEAFADEWFPVVAQFGNPTARPVWDTTGYEIRMEDIH